MCFRNHLYSVILRKSLSNYSFKQSLAYIPSLGLTPKLSFEPRFRKFIINDYSTKTKCLSSLGILVYFALIDVSRKFWTNCCRKVHGIK